MDAEVVEQDASSALVAREHETCLVLVCHEDVLLGGGLARRVERVLGVSTEVATSVADAVDLLESNRADLIVCSDRLRGAENLAAVVALLRGSGVAAPVLALVRVDSSRSFMGALEAGVSGYLPLARAADDLAATVTAMLGGRSVLSMVRGGAAGPRLTDREQEVLEACDHGLSDKQIATQLGVAISTVRTHIRSIYRKLDATSRTEALHKARGSGLL